MSYFNYDGANKRPYKHKRVQTFSSYLHAVLKKKDENASIGKKSMAVMNSLVKDLFYRLITEAVRSLKVSKKRTIGSREVETAVKLVLTGNLAKHAVSVGTKAVTTFNDATKKAAKDRIEKSAKAAAKDKSEKIILSKSAISGLQFPVGRILSLIKKNKELASRVKINAGVYLSAVLEYIASEIFQLVTDAMANKEKNDGKKESKGYRINTRHLKLAIVGDAELLVLFKGTTIPSAGVKEFIHPILLKKAPEPKPMNEVGQITGSSSDKQAERVADVKKKRMTEVERIANTPGFRK